MFGIAFGLVAMMLVGLAVYVAFPMLVFFGLILVYAMLVLAYGRDALKKRVTPEERLAIERKRLKTETVDWEYEQVVGKIRQEKRRKRLADLEAGAPPEYYSPFGDALDSWFAGDGPMPEAMRPVVSRMAQTLARAAQDPPAEGTEASRGSVRDMLGQFHKANADPEAGNG